MLHYRRFRKPDGIKTGNLLQEARDKIQSIYVSILWLTHIWELVAEPLSYADVYCSVVYNYPIQKDSCTSISAVQRTESALLRMQSA